MILGLIDILTTVIFPWIILLAYVGCVFHIIIYLHYQYTYDYHLNRLRQFRKFDSKEDLRKFVHQVPTDYAEKSLNSLDFHGLDYSLRKTEFEIANTIRLVDDLLTEFGGPQIHLTFIVEQFYLVLLLISSGVYLFAMLYTRVNGHHCYVVRYYIGLEEDEANLERLVKKLIKEFQDSWIIFHKLKHFHSYFEQDLELLEAYVGLETRVIRHREKLSAIEKGSLVHRRALSEKVPSSTKRSDQWLDRMVERGTVESSTYSQIEELYNEQVLRPLNQSPSWINKRTLLHCFYYNWGIFYGTVLFVGMIRLLNHDDAKTFIKAHNAFIVFLYKVEFLFMCFLSVFSATFYSANFLVRSVDQVVLVTRTTRLMKLCIQMNTTLFNEAYSNRSLGTGPNRLHENLRKQMNKNLLLALMHFKMYLIELNGSVRKSFNIFIVAIMLLLGMPLIMLLHVPYVENVDSFRISAAISSCFMLPPANLNLIPLCHLHNRSLQLYTSMSNLLAHAVEVNDFMRQSQLGSKAGANTIYDEHTITLIRKELSHPHGVEKRFATNFMGMHCTYLLICKVHFWFGFLLLYIVAGKQGNTKEAFLTGFL